MKKEDDKTHQTWFIRHDGLPMGPLPGAKIRGMLLHGDLELTDQISADSKNWVRIDSVPEVVPLQLRADAGDPEAVALLKAREKSSALDNAEERRFPMTAVIVMLLVIGGIIGVAIWTGMPDSTDTPQCDAAPAPGVNWRNCVLNGMDAGSASLAGADLSSAVLRNARLSATDLNGANLRYVNLSGSDLSYAQLKTAVLMGANLQGVDLRGADLSNSDLRYADLSRSLLDNAEFKGAVMEGVIWSDGTTCAANSIGRCLPSMP